VNDWWSDVEADLLRCLDGRDAVAPADVAARLGVSEDAAVSLLAMLAREGRVKICLVSGASGTAGDGGRRARAAGSRAGGRARRAPP